MELGRAGTRRHNLCASAERQWLLHSLVGRTGVVVTRRPRDLGRVRIAVWLGVAWNVNFKKRLHLYFVFLFFFLIYSFLISLVCKQSIPTVDPISTPRYPDRNGTPVLRCQHSEQLPRAYMRQLNYRCLRSENQCDMDRVTV